MKIYIQSKSIKKKHLPEVEKKFKNTIFVYDEKDSYDCEVIIAMPNFISEENLDKYKNVKWIQITTAGFDSSDLDYARNRGIILTNARDVYSVAIAEDVILKILVLNRNVKRYLENMKTGTWEPNYFEPELYGATIGIIGMGSIGIEIAKRIQSFGTKVIGHRRNKKAENFFDEIYVGDDGLNHLLQESDYVILAVPLNDGTRDLINYDKLKLMKKNAILINIARGEVVVQDDLIKALQLGLIRGAALDVMVPEPLPSNNPLWKMDNVYITPHCSASSNLFVNRLIWLLEENLQRYINKEEVKNIINE